MMFLRTAMLMLALVSAAASLSPPVSAYTEDDLRRQRAQFEHRQWVTRRLHEARGRWCGLDHEEVRALEGRSRQEAERFFSYVMNRYRPPHSTAGLDRLVKDLCSVKEITREMFALSRSDNRIETVACYLPLETLVAISVEPPDYDAAKAYAARTQGACRRYYREVFFKTARARLARREAEQRKARDEARRRREAEERARAERARKEAEAARQAAARRSTRRAEAFAAAGVPESQRVVWGGEKPRPPRLSGGDVRYLLNEVNLRFQARMEPPQAEFIPPPRDEFEKTRDYQVRVSELRRRHRERIAREAAQRRARLAAILSEVLTEMLGTPRIEAVRYDADAEVFAVEAGRGALRVTGTLPVPIAQARQRKARLLRMTPWVLWRLESGRLVPRALVLQDGDETLSLAVRGAPSPVAFTAAQARAWEQAKAEDARRRAAEAAERRRRERASWPEGAVARVRGGAILCASHTSALRAAVLERAGNPYVSYPGDCITLPEAAYAAVVQPVASGLYQVQLLGAHRPGFTAGRNVEQ